MTEVILVLFVELVIGHGRETFAPEYQSFFYWHADTLHTSDQTDYPCRSCAVKPSRTGCTADARNVADASSREGYRVNFACRVGNAAAREHQPCLP